MRLSRCSSVVVSAAALTACADDQPPMALPSLTPQVSGTTQLLQAVSPVNDSVIWVSGHGGTYARTTDGGASWTAAVVPDADTLQFRDVHAVDANTAYLLGAGPADMSRIYKTTDAGATWELQWVNSHPEGFYDCIDFWDAERGAVYGDEVDGHLSLLTTSDGGTTWSPVPPERLPAAQDGEGGFAASGLCLITGPDGRGWVATGAADTARVLMTENYGHSWTAVNSPIPGGSGAGHTAVSFRGGSHGIVLGGNIAEPEGRTDNVAVSHDGGNTWAVAGRPTITGAFYGGGYVPGVDAAWVVGVGPGGADYSVDNGASWVSLDTLTYWAVAFATPTAGWMVGPGGRITKVRMY
jgi:photosystem II stability/assembly factor-like uncharacterized protein